MNRSNSMVQALAIVSTGVCCPVGLSTAEAATSLRAGISRKIETGYIDDANEPIVIGHVSDGLLEPLKPELRGARPTRVERRIARLASPALREALAILPEPAALPLLLAGPQPAPEQATLAGHRVLDLISYQAGCGLDRPNSRLFALGRAGMFAAIAAAAELLHSGRARFVLVGGADSYLDPARLRALACEGRLRGAGPGDTMTPGEGAGLVMLATQQTCAQLELRPRAWIGGVGLALEPGHRYSDQPYLAEGLAHAVDDLYAKLWAPAAPIELALTGLTGESHPTKEWGVCLMRHRERFADAVQFEHAAEYIGDAGAGLAPIMLAVATHLPGRPRGSALLWGASDRGQRGALISSPHV